MTTETLYLQQADSTLQHERFAQASEADFEQNNDKTTLTSLLLGLSLRDKFTDSEKQFLDSLVGDNSLIFLIKDRQFVHPEDTPLFPMETIETALNESGEAIFSHRYRTRRNANDLNFVIHTARVRLDGKRSLILGVLSPENIFRQHENFNHFQNLREQFRTAASTARPVFEKISQNWQSSLPQVIFDRTDSSLLTANRAALRHFKCEMHHLTGMEFGAFKDQYSSKLTMGKINLEDYSAEDQVFTGLTLDPRNDVSTAKEPGMQTYFMNSITEKVSCLTTAASLLEDLTDIGRESEESELVRIMLREVKELDMQVTRLNLINNFQTLPKHDCKPLLELEKAVARIRQDTLEQHQIDIYSDLKNSLFTAPPQALTYLFRAVLQSHLSHPVIGGTTGINALENNISLIFEISTSYGEPFGNASTGYQWQNFTRELCKNLGAGIKNYEDTEARTRTTVITLPKTPGK